MFILSWLKFQTKKFKQKQTYLRSFQKFQGYSGEKLNWLKVTLRLQESVIPAILPGSSGYGFLVTLIYELGEWQGLYKPAQNGSEVIPDLILSFQHCLEFIGVYGRTQLMILEGRKLGVL